MVEEISSVEKVENVKSTSSPNWGVLFGVLVTISTVLLWTAGYCYTAGYWGAAHLSQSFINRSFQEVLIYGTVPEWNWLGLILMSGGYCLLFFLFSFRFELPDALLKAAKDSPKHRKFKIDPEAIRLSVVFGAICALTLICVFVMRIFWMPNAIEEGRARFFSDLCDEKIRAENKEPASATIVLSSEKSLRGKILHHAEKYIILLDETGISIISNADNLRLVGTVAAPPIECKDLFPQKYKKNGADAEFALDKIATAKKTRTSWAAFLAMLAVCSLACAMSCWARIYSLNAHDFPLPENRASKRSKQIYLFVHTVRAQNSLNRYASLSILIAALCSIFSWILLA